MMPPVTLNEAPKPSPPNRSTFHLDSGWPNQPPVFPPLTATDELRVPLASHLLAQPIEPIHGSVRQGERLVNHAAQSSHLAIVPADAIAEAELQVPLLDGRQVPAARLRLKSSDENESSSTKSNAGITDQTDASRPIRRADDFAEIQPADLGAWIDRLRDGGIWVDRWASPNLLGQLNACLRRPVDTLICNVLDVDPAVPLNAALAANHPIELLAGLTLLSRITSATRAWIVTDAKAPVDWSAQLRNITAETARPAGLRVMPLINDYPQADPSLLLYALLNRRLRPGRLPAELGALVLDSAAAIAVGQLALTGQPMLTVPLAVRDHARRESHFCTVPIGTLLTHVLRRLGLPPVQQLVLRGGDVLRDIHLTEDAVVGGTELLVHASPLEPPINPDPCVRCGWCFEACPTYVQPANCLEAAQRDDADLAIRFGIEACIDCGICSYVCPSHLPILSGIRWMRGRLEE
jgi:Na+-translocating ferredoxin:NAD+ oxidoreductase RnfC subunit